MYKFKEGEARRLFIIVVRDEGLWRDWSVFVICKWVRTAPTLGPSLTTRIYHKVPVFILEIIQSSKVTRYGSFFTKFNLHVWRILKYKKIIGPSFNDLKRLR